LLRLLATKRRRRRRRVATAESNTTSEVQAKIPGGARLDIGNCKDGWLACHRDLARKNFQQGEYLS